MTISPNLHSSPVTRFIGIFVLWMMRGWVSCLRFQRRRSRIWTLAVWLQPPIRHCTAYGGWISLWETPSFVHCHFKSPWRRCVEAWAGGGGEQKGGEGRKYNGVPWDSRKMLLTPALHFLTTTPLGRDVRRTPGNSANRKDVELRAPYQRFSRWRFRPSGHFPVVLPGSLQGSLLGWAAVLTPQKLSLSSSYLS